MTLLADLLYLSLDQLVDALTGLERILTTPIPVSYEFARVSVYDILIYHVVTPRTCGWLHWFIVQPWCAPILSSNLPLADVSAV
jgi:predicted membrane chloride channel (bestrophin family)